MHRRTRNHRLQTEDQAAPCPVLKVQTNPCAWESQCPQKAHQHRVWGLRKPPTNTELRARREGAHSSSVPHWGEAVPVPPISALRI